MTGLPSTPVAIALGSNLGERRAHLSFAVDRLHRVLSDIHVSSWYETDPVGVAPQPKFLNGVVIGRVAQTSPRELLNLLLDIERERGRVRPHPGAPRTLDLDLILYGNMVMREPGLRIPHPRYRERRFVLEPLAEVAADWTDPETGRRVGELLAELTNEELRTKNEERNGERGTGNGT